MQCPACQSEDVRPAKPHGGDGIRHRLFFTPYRCRDCKHRFWVKSPFRQLAAGGAVLIAATLFALAAMHDTGTAPVSDDRISLLRARAEKNDVHAQFQLGRAYADGDGVLTNAREAVRLYKLAAKAGDLEAQYHLGLSLLEGHGVVQDYQAAFKWLEQAANKGYPQAQYDLGRLYYYGMGVPVDKMNAYVWFNLAAARGVEEAARNRDYALQQLAPDQVAKAQARAREMNEKLLGLPSTEAEPAENTEPAERASP
jgi:uncharacterized protein